MARKGKQTLGIAGTRGLMRASEHDTTACAECGDKVESKRADKRTCSEECAAAYQERYVPHYPTTAHSDALVDYDYQRLGPIVLRTER